MELEYSDDCQAFRQTVRAFLASHWPASPPAAALEEAEREFRRRAVEAGFMHRSVPRRYGGSEQPADPIKAQIIREEFSRAHAPAEAPGNANGPRMVVPTLLEWGTEEQKQRFIPPTLSGAYLWAQAYSEPNAGSDLASLRTRAELINGEWIINGQKIWSSLAHQCNFLFVLVRTEPAAPKHEGLSYLLLDARQPGVTIRRLKQITGGAQFCEIFFDDARTPASWVVGARGRGWEVSRTTLRYERTGIGGADVMALFDKLVALARATERQGRSALEDPIIQNRLVSLESRVRALAFSSNRSLSMRARNQDPGVIELMSKLILTHIHHEVAGIARDLMGDHFMLAPLDASSARAGGAQKWNNMFMGSLALGMGGGTSNIQRNIIAERGLGLPREPGH
jgi:alkylation response protein AidB-like acyl-CoA dehydrogenase